MLNALTAHIMSANIPQPSPKAPAEVKSKIDTLLGFALYGVMAACVAGMLFCAARMAFAHRNGELQDKAGGLAAVMVACLVGASASALVKFVWM